MKLINLLQRIRRPNVKQLATAGVFSLALAGSIGLGVHVRNTASAAVVRDCKTNSIDYVDFGGGCGAATPTELIADIKNNKPSDLQTIYSHFGLTPSVYTQFINTAKTGAINVDGTVTVDGQVVMNNVVTYGRENFGTGRKPIVIDGKTYYYGTPANSFASGIKSLPAMVMFNDQGVATLVVMNACGNLATGTPVTPNATCNALQSVQSKTNPNSWTFTTTASFGGNASLSRVVYHFSDGRKDVTTTSLTAPVDATFTKDVTVTATVYAQVPGGKEIVAKAIDCSKTIKYTPPMFVCTALVASAIDDKTFRFTVKTASDKNTTVKDVDFILDGKTTTAGVTAKDTDGNIFKEYTFSDTSSHTVAATVFFNTLEGVKSDSGNCTATVTPKEQPKCTVPGHTTEAPNSPTCGFCQPGIPIGSPQCTPTPPPTPPTTPPVQLVNTGAGNVIGLFMGTTIVAFAAHKFFLSRRIRRAAASQSI